MRSASGAGRGSSAARLGCRPVRSSGCRRRCSPRRSGCSVSGGGGAGSVLPHATLVMIPGGVGALHRGRCSRPRGTGTPTGAARPGGDAVSPTWTGVVTDPGWHRPRVAPTPGCCPREYVPVSRVVAATRVQEGGTPVRPPPGPPRGGVVLDFSRVCAQERVRNGTSTSDPRVGGQASLALPAPQRAGPLRPRRLARRERHPGCR